MDKVIPVYDVPQANFITGGIINAKNTSQKVVPFNSFQK